MSARTTIAGVAIPDSALAREATDFVQDASTTRQVTKYKQPEVRLVALGVQYDLYGSPFDALSPEQRDAVLAAHPRTKFKTGMIEALAAGISYKPQTAVGTMMTDILEATVPGYERPNFCDLVRNSRFET